MRASAGRSLWDATLPDEMRGAYAPLRTGIECDVAIVGAGLTGLWTAYYLAERDPSLRIVVLERDTVGFGASGRNGGWCSAALPMSPATVARAHGETAARALQRAMIDTVGEVGRVLAHEGIDAHFDHGGTVQLARSEVQARRLRAEVETARSHGLDADDLRWLGADEARRLCDATGVVGATYTPHCAALHPARLVHGVAAAVVRRGVTIHEHTPAIEIASGSVVTAAGTVRAGAVIRATEAFTAELAGSRREILPLYSLMIATEPLDAPALDAIGLLERPTFHDARHLIVYGQRTADGRIAFGGRGAPYHFGSAIRPEFDTDESIARHLEHALTELFPQLSGVAVTHHWGGPLGVARDWQCAVRWDAGARIGSAGGYVGDGVATTNLAGRTLADLVTGTTSELTALAWVNHRSRRWEPEPLRWVGVNAGRLVAARADAHEARTGTESRLWGGVLRALVPK